MFGFLSLSASAQSDLSTPARQAMEKLAQHILGANGSVHLLGVTTESEKPCELTIARSGLVFSIVGPNGRLSSDNVYSPYWSFIEEGSRIDQNSFARGADGLSTWVVSVSSSEDQSSAALVYRENTARVFKGGQFSFDRGTPVTCVFRQAVLDEAISHRPILRGSAGR